MSSNYGNESIRSLTDREAVRLRPANTLGSDDVSGAFHTVIEIVGNSIDEVKAGFGKEVVITKHKDLSYSVRDSGRGVPLSFNKSEGKYNYELVFMSLHAGGKYSPEEDGTFEYSIGLSGLGSAISALSSEHFLVISHRDGKKHTLTMDKGFFTDYKEEDSISPTGTYIKWKPDLEVFKGNDIPFEWIREYGKEQAVVNKQTKIVVIDENTDTKEEFYYENGIQDYLKEVSSEKELTSFQYFDIDTKGRDREDLPEYRARFEVAFTFNNDVNMLASYHNSSYLKHGGSPHVAMKSAFAYALHRYASDNSLYKKKEKRITWDDIEDSLIVISNTYSMQTSYANQTKHAITNEFIREYMNTWLREQLEIYFTENPDEAKKIVEQVLINKRSSESAEASRTRLRQKLSKEVNNLSGRIEKFVNCKSKDPSKREVFFVEGDSALGNIKQARNPDTQAMYALRGKILNVFKSPIEKAIANDIVADILRILDTGIEVRDSKSKKLNTFNLSKCKWDKIILTSDSDVDGAHINTLILTLLYKFTPQLIEQGKVYIAESPLYELIYKNNTIFAYSEQEKDSLLKKHGSNCLIQRNKGLGQATKEVISETIMNPETRKLIKVTMDNYENSFETLDSLMGSDVSKRRDVIVDYLDKFIEEVS